MADAKKTGPIIAGVIIAIAGIMLAPRILRSIRGPSDGERTGRVTLYSSVDDALLEQVLGDIEVRARTNIRHLGDTEITKTTGLVERLIQEKGRPRADVWWSSEPFGTIRLAREGVLAPLPLDPDELIEGGWPDTLVGEGNLWVGFAQRARVIAYSTDRVAQPPTTLRELTDEAWRGRVGMARPQFGTTRGHMGALAALWGESEFEAWLAAMKTNGLVIFDGNAAVVREIALGTIDVGLADTDDVFAAQREGRAVGLAYEIVDPPGEDGATPRWHSAGALLIPNTVAMVKGARDEVLARRVIRHILSDFTEREFARSDSHNFPIREQLRSALGDIAPPEHTIDLRLGAIADAIPGAMAICERVLN
ncbi:MAG: extracellular solute-binding protein [Phycisphaeraceae bacterium]|nr:extracellular solute-binding protein [Phycisphaeraceae bacterium]